MTTKMKKTIIAIARNKKIYNGIGILFCTIAVIFIFCAILDVPAKLNIPRVIFYILGVILIITYLIIPPLRIIRNESDQVLEDNNLLYIILSKFDFLSALALVITLILFQIINNIINSIILGIVVLIAFILILIKGIPAINFYFKNKLSKKKG